jgi:hypothetical protein
MVFDFGFINIDVEVPKTPNFLPRALPQFEFKSTLDTIK